MTKGASQRPTSATCIHKVPCPARPRCGTGDLGLVGVVGVAVARGVRNAFTQPGTHGRCRASHLDAPSPADGLVAPTKPRPLPGTAAANRITPPPLSDRSRRALPMRLAAPARHARPTTSQRPSPGPTATREARVQAQRMSPGTGEDSRSHGTDWIVLLQRPCRVRCARGPESKRNEHADRVGVRGCLTRFSEWATPKELPRQAKHAQGPTSPAPRSCP
jgi:hypothetical protein